MLEFNKTNFATLEDAQIYVYEEETHKITEGLCKQFLLNNIQYPSISPLFNDKWAHMRSIRSDLSNPHSSVIDIMMTRLESNGHFEVNPNTQAGLGNIYIANSLIGVLFKDANEVGAFLDLSVHRANPYQDKTQADWDALDNIGVYSSQSIEWRQGQDIVVNLLEPIESGASVTTWLTNEGFAPENMGRSVYVSNALKYTIRMSDKRGNGTIEVRVNNSNAQFELEAI